jgi:hypothetical protein
MASSSRRLGKDIKREVDLVVVPRLEAHDEESDNRATFGTNYLEDFLRLSVDR